MSLAGGGSRICIACLAFLVRFRREGLPCASVNRVPSPRNDALAGNGGRTGVDKAKVRLFVEGRLEAGGCITLNDRQAHYVTTVMRLGCGARLRLFNAADGEWLGRIDDAGRGRCVMTIEAQCRHACAEPGPTLAFAPVKKDAIDFIVIKATELGAAALLPVWTRFTAVQRLNLERLRANAIEAAEQCGRLTVPTIAEPVPLAALIAGWAPEQALLVFDRDRGGPLKAVITAAAGRALPPPGLLTGPEGGLAPEELDVLEALPFVTAVAMGPRTLRADTAAIAALACWQAFAGDW
ncbi:MAG: 16S rRNA (uracil(1498)-N(3))-methyltransferase [Rhodospirillales bacterium]|nr:16S rRNA (uracil(1498)-N(3))-methyltransferase [Rhodospirillales bacterium]